MMRYCFASDGDGHTYIIPAEKKAEFMRQIDLMETEDDWEVLASHEALFEMEFGDCMVGMHHTNFSFENWQEMK